MIKRYGVIDAILPDPAYQARELGLVGKHHPLARELVGAWRWPTLNASAEGIVPIVKQPKVVDLGGAAGPVGYGTIVVDYEHPERKAIWDVAGRLDAIISCHTLEHVEDAELFLMTCAAKIRAGGVMIVLVPSWKNEHLHHREWPFHRRTYSLGETDPEARDADDLRALMAGAFDTVLHADYGEDGNLLAIASKRPPDGML